MIDPAAAFSIGGLLAMLGWLELIAALFAERIRGTAQLTATVLVPGLLSMAYILLIFEGWGADGGGYGSIEEVRALFASDAALAAGWLHYLAFDLFVGAWITREGLRVGVPRLLLLPCFALTFLFGPAGLLLFLLLRLAFARFSETAK